ncbi:MAG: PIN domain-containing protein [Candidatus Omnitrophota bacterium]
MPTRKTLIVFDTNRLRQVISDGPAYHTFSFGAEFERLKNFLSDNGLDVAVSLATTRMTLSELLKQKTEQFKADKGDLKAIVERMSALPGVNFGTVQLTDAGFDCHSHLSPKVEEFLRLSNVLLIDLPEGKYAAVLKRMLERSINKRTPFVRTDSGFKDVIIWESLLHYDRLAEYDKVYLVSNDGGFDDCCKTEFEVEKRKTIIITSSVQMLIENLEDDYENEIEVHKHAQFAGTDYFKDHINGIVSGLTSLTIDGVDCGVRDIRIGSYLDSVQYPLEEDTGISVILVSIAQGKALIDREEKTVNIKIKTSLDEAQGIQNTDMEIDTGSVCRS